MTTAPTTHQHRNGEAASAAPTTFVRQEQAQAQKEQPALHWQPSAFVLLVENRTCAHCFNTYSAPSPHLYVRLVSVYPGGKRVRLTRRSAIAIDITDLPHLREDVHLQVERCERCFELDDGKQLPLFPRKPRRRLTWQDILTIKRREALDKDEDQRAARARARAKLEATRKPPSKKAKYIADVLKGL